MSLHLIIDGYNLIRQSPEFRQYEKRELEQGREMLLKKLSMYQRIKKHGITVVFDGWVQGNLHESHGQVRGIEVIFSRRGIKADEVIKRLASQKKREATIVTSDQGLGYSCTLEGCEVISSQEFASKMELSEYFDQKGMEKEHDNGPRFNKGTKKKGPAKRIPKSERHHRILLKKL